MALIRAMHVPAKICGLSTPETVEAAVACGAGFIGFNFFPASPRFVEPEVAARLAEPARAAGVRHHRRRWRRYPGPDRPDPASGPDPAAWPGVAGAGSRGHPPHRSGADSRPAGGFRRRPCGRRTLVRCRRPPPAGRAPAGGCRNDRGAGPGLRLDDHRGLSSAPALVSRGGSRSLECRRGPDHFRGPVGGRFLWRGARSRTKGRVIDLGLPRRCPPSQTLGPT